MKIEVIPTDKPVGAEVRGVDLAANLDALAVERIVGALDAHGVVFIRKQFLNPSAHVAFSRALGPLRAPRVNPDPLVPGYPDLTYLSNIYENGKPIGLLEAGQYWHTDNCFKLKPNRYAVLYAEEIPMRDGKALGGTMFASAEYAYETLPEDLRRQLTGLRARHNFRNPFHKQELSADATKILWEEAREPDAIHPVVRTHPRTARKCIYVNEHYTVGIDGMPDNPGRALIDQLCRHVTRPDVIYTHRWQPGDVLVWDDCAVQHHAIADYVLPLRRKLRRATVAGEIPV